MTTVTETFTSEEIVKINSAKTELQNIIKSASIYEYHSYNPIKCALLRTELADSDISKLVIAGGAIPSLLEKAAVHDVDVFVLDLNIDLFEKMIGNKTGPWVVKYFFDDKDDPRPDDYKNDHVFAVATNKSTMVQYILTDHKDRKSLLADFDYLHCTASYHESKLYINRETYDAIHKKQLIRQNKNRAPKAWREQKFMQRGWKNEADSMLESSKTLKEILTDNLKQIQSSPYLIKGNSNAITWNNPKKPYSYQDLEDDLRNLLAEDPYLQTK